MLNRVALVRTDISEERIISIIRMTRTGELGITLTVTSNRSTRCKEMLRNSCHPDDGGDKFLRNVGS
jgi:hypothetical protein